MKSLITITTCNRLHEVKKYILPYIDFCNRNEEFDFLLSLDGDNSEYLEFCNEFQIPLLYSDEREGVGLSKNRVLKQFPNYDYYFFIEDDVELIDASIFQENIDYSVRHNIPHLSRCAFDEKGEMITEGFKAGAQFNFFEAKALFQVGGWNTLFAKHKRFGHSEHSFRFYNIELQKYPFIALKNNIKKIVVHDPPHVTRIEHISNDGHYHSDEKALIAEKTTYFPLQTLSTYYFNGYNCSCNLKVANYLKAHKRKYPLIKGRERCKCFGEYYFYKFQQTHSLFGRIRFLCASVFLYPNNNMLKHYIKKKITKL